MFNNINKLFQKKEIVKPNGSSSDVEKREFQEKVRNYVEIKKLMPTAEVDLNGGDLDITFLANPRFVKEGERFIHQNNPVISIGIAQLLKENKYGEKRSEKETVYGMNLFGEDLFPKGIADMLIGKDKEANREAMIVAYKEKIDESIERARDELYNPKSGQERLRDLLTIEQIEEVKQAAGDFITEIINKQQELIDFQGAPIYDSYDKRQEQYKEKIAEAAKEFETSRAIEKEFSADVLKEKADSENPMTGV